MSIAAFIRDGLGGRPGSVIKGGLASYKSLPEPPASGYRYTILTQPGGGWDAQAIPYNQSPPVVSNDVLITPLLTVPGSYVITPGADGILSVDTHSDASLQILTAVDIYDVSGLALYGADDFAIGDQSPSPPDPGSVVFLLAKDVAIVPIDLTGYAVSPYGLPLTVTEQDAEPTGLTLNNGILSGIPTVRAISSITYRSTDPFGLSIDWDAIFVIGQVPVPNVVDTPQAQAEDALIAAYVNFAYGLPDYDDTIPLGNVKSQSPGATTLVNAGSFVTLVLSLGPTPPPPGGYQVVISLGAP